MGDIKKPRFRAVMIEDMGSKPAVSTDKGYRERPRIRGACLPNGPASCEEARTLNRANSGKETSLLPVGGGNLRDAPGSTGSRERFPGAFLWLIGRVLSRESRRDDRYVR